jgi:hypothetical protein
MFEVIVQGTTACSATNDPVIYAIQDVVLYPTEDELVAHSVATNYRSIGWKNITVRDTNENTSHNRSAKSGPGRR